MLKQFTTLGLILGTSLFILSCHKDDDIAESKAMYFDKLQFGSQVDSSFRVLDPRGNTLPVFISSTPDPTNIPEFRNIRKLYVNFNVHNYNFSPVTVEWYYNEILLGSSTASNTVKNGMFYAFITYPNHDIFKGIWEVRIVVEGKVFLTGSCFVKEGPLP